MKPFDNLDDFFQNIIEMELEEEEPAEQSAIEEEEQAEKEATV